MTYHILYSKHAFQDAKKLDPIVRKKIGRAIEKFSKNPLMHAKKMISSKLGSYRWRAGNYRIIFDLEGNAIYILRIGHRKEIYR